MPEQMFGCNFNKSRNELNEVSNGINEEHFGRPYYVIESFGT
ncbi:hypothetical protein [Clostridium thermarum]|nr:hypothetical protein [Clostridium thermarum]